MESISLMNSKNWLSIIKDRPDIPEDIEADDFAAMQDYVADMFEWTFSVTLASQGLTSDKAVSDKIAQNLAR